MLQDLRFAIRSLSKSPRFSLIAILVLALGIGASTAMFSVVYHVRLRPLPYDGASRLVFLRETSIRRGGWSPTAPATYTDWRDQQHVFESIAAAEAWGATLTGRGRTEELPGLRVSPSLFSVLRTKPLLGRTLLPEDESAVVLSHRLWQRLFGGDTRAIGQSLTMNGARYQVVGVMPPAFRFPPFWALKTELWVPLTFSPLQAASRNGRSLRVFARLRDGVSLQQASAEMSTISERLAQAYPASLQDRGASVVPLAEIVVGDVGQTLWVLLGAVGFLLLIASANVANLLLGRANGRSRETAVRLALGASRWRLVRHLLAESAALSAAGCVLGVVFAWWLLNALTGSIAEASRFTLPRYQEISIGGGALLFSTGLTVLTAIAFGLVPALRSTRPVLHDALKQGTRGTSGGRGRLGSVLVASELAVSLMLLSGAALMVRSFARLGAVDAGFDPRNVLTMGIGAAHLEPAQRLQFYRRILDRAAAVPGVQLTSGVNHLPLAGDVWTFSFTVEGRPDPPPSETPGAIFRVAFPEYFRTMRIPILRGRDFTWFDGPGTERVVIVNQTMARRYWPDQDAVGKRIRQGSGWYTIVGVVKDSGQSDWGAATRNEFYFPQLQNPDNIQRYLTLVVRTAGDPLAPAAAIEAAVLSLDRDAPVSSIASMRQVVDRALWQPRFSTTLFTGFAALALLLAAIGVYGVISHDVSSRTQEIGIRMALGARPRAVLRPVLGRAVKLAAIGLMFGTAGALALSRYLKTLLYEVSPTDPMSLGGAALVFALVALAAAWFPARRATKVDPVTALR